MKYLASGNFKNPMKWVTIIFLFRERFILIIKYEHNKLKLVFCHFIKMSDYPHTNIHPDKLMSDVCPKIKLNHDSTSEISLTLTYFMTTTDIVTFILII